MTTYEEFFSYFLKNLVWPLKGIAFVEFYLLAWVWAFAKDAFITYGIIGLIILTIIFAIRTTMGIPRSSRRDHILRHIIIFFIAIVLRVLLAWVYLGVGVFNGRLDETHIPRTLRIERVGPQIRLRFENHATLHYRLGRWVYRRLYTLIGRIPNINPNWVTVLARIIGGMICFWGVWRIPSYF